VYSMSGLWLRCLNVQMSNNSEIQLSVDSSSYGLIGYAFEWKQVDSVSASSYSFSSEQSKSRWIDVSVGVFTVERVPALDDAVSQEVMTDESLSWLEAKHLLDKRWILHFTEIGYSSPGKELLEKTSQHKLESIGFQVQQLRVEFIHDFQLSKCPCVPSWCWEARVAARIGQD
jgi:hypothetical protein